MMPGRPYPTELTGQEVTPGRKYWVQATMFCKVKGGREGGEWVRNEVLSLL